MKNNLELIRVAFLVMKMHCVIIKIEINKIIERRQLLLGKY